MFQIARAGKVLGTFTQSSIAYKLKWSQGEILPSDFYWTNGMSDWKMVSEKTDWEATQTPTPAPSAENEAPKPITGVKSINGTVLSFSIQQSSGLIAGDDSIRYAFSAKSWRAGIAPTNGMRVTFVSQEGEAVDVFPLSNAAQGQRTGGTFTRSSNRKVIGGVCAGLAAHWRIDVVMLRVIITVLALFGSMMVFGLVVPVIYIGLWIFTAEAPTE
jgi:phage shock protein PspC (stress-responsive transcriptional regulator)